MNRARNQAGGTGRGGRIMPLIAEGERKILEFRMGAGSMGIRTGFAGRTIICVSPRALRRSDLFCLRLHPKTTMALLHILPIDANNRNV